MASTSTCRKCSTTSTTKTDSVNGQTYSNTHDHDIRPQEKQADQVLLLEMKPKMLGVTLDTHHVFQQHCNNIAVKVQQRNYALKALSGSTLGCDKEALITTYQVIGRSILSYCSPVWMPSHKDTNTKFGAENCHWLS